MLWLLILLILIGWALGIFVFNLGGLLHVLLVVALIMLIVNLVRGEAP